MKIREEIRANKGYQILITMLDSYFGQDYIIRKITYDDLDPTGLDFQLSVDFPRLKEVNVDVASSGPNQVFRIGGDDFIGIAVPKEGCLGILTSGEKGEGLGKILGDSALRWGAGLDNIESVDKYSDVFKKYYDSL